jgi:hypothetical protein
MISTPIHDGRLGVHCGSDDSDLAHWTITGEVTCVECHKAARVASDRAWARIDAHEAAFEARMEDLAKGT